MTHLSTLTCLVAQSCPTLCDSMDCGPSGSSVHGNSPDKNIGVGCHVLLQGIFQTQDQTQVSCIAGGFFTIWVTREAKNTGVVSPSLLQGIFPTQELNQGLLQGSFPTQELNQGLLLCRRILYQLSYQGSPSISMCYVLISLVMSDSLRPYGLTLPGSSVCGILHTRILEWVSMLSSRGSSQPGIKPVSLCDPMGCSPSGFSAHGIFQARRLEWVAISYTMESPWPRDQHTSLASPALAGRFFTTSATWEASFFFFTALSLFILLFLI